MLRKKDLSQKIINFSMLVIILVSLCATTILAVKTFTVLETDSVSLDLESTDADGDEVVYYYSTPFNEEGEWDTNYDDSGEYFIDITASDGINKSIETIKIIVENKNQAPTFINENLNFNETDIIDLKDYIVDHDEDILEYKFEEPFNQNGVWVTNYEDAGRYVIDVEVNDQDVDVEKRLEIIIDETNQPPTITSAFSGEDLIMIKENESLVFEASAEDYDGQDINYSWTITKQDENESLTDELITTLQQGEKYFDFESSGEYTLSLIVSDGDLDSKKEWDINVEHVNRAPNVEDLEVIFLESETIEIEFQQTDLDGDNLTYSYGEILDEDGTWETDYDSAGNYTITITASDGELETDFNVTITIIDVDRAPQITLPELLEISEGQTFNWDVAVEDLDGDEVELKFTGLPEGVILNQENNSISWDVSYNQITRRSNFFYNILNSLRLEKCFTGKDEIPFEIEACGKDKCTTVQSQIVVYNTNRAPEFIEFYNQNINETESVKLYVDAIDPDGDIVKYTFTEPLSKSKGEWDTTYDDSGIHNIYVTASDGFLTTTQVVNITVNHINRNPSIDAGDDEIKVNEGQEFTINVDVSDPDMDELDLSISNLPEGASFYEGRFVWTPNFDIVSNKTTTSWFNKLIDGSGVMNRKFDSNQETIWLDFTVSDGDFEVVHPIKVDIKDVNRLPVVKMFNPVASVLNGSVGDLFEFEIEVYDLDNDPLVYEWTFSGFDFEKIEGTNKITRKFTSSGEKKVQVVVSDGYDSVEQEWLVYVEPVAEELNFINTDTQTNSGMKIYTIENWK